MKKNMITFLLIASAISCQQDSNFQDFLEHFKIDYQQHFKIPSTPLVIISKEKMEKDLAFCAKQLQALATFDTLQLNPENQNAWANTQIKLEKKISQIQVYHTLPDCYNIQIALQKVADQKEWNSTKKLSIWQKQLELTPLFYSAAKENLTNVDAKNAKETWNAHIKTFLFLNQTLTKELAQSDWTNKQKDTFLVALTSAELAVKDYIAFCRSAVLNR